MNGISKGWLLATSADENSASRSFFWTGLILGTVVTAFGMTWWNYDGRKYARKPKQKRAPKPPSSRGGIGGRMGMLLSSRSQALRDLGKDPSFLSDIFEQLWPFMKVAGAESIRGSVEPSLAELPAPMNSSKFTKLDLGDEPIRMDNIVVHPLENGSVQFDMDMDWESNCDFQLKTGFGTLGIKELELHGRMGIILKPLTTELSVVSGIQYSFLNMPKISMKFTGLAAVAELSVLESTVQDALKSSLISSCLPCRMLYKMNVNNDFFDTYTPPVGVLQLNLESGKGFVIEKRLLAKDDIPDVYLNVTLGADPTTYRTKTIMDDLDPVWYESGTFCLFDMEQELLIHAWDEDHGPMDPDDDLGTTSVTVADLIASPNQTVTMPLVLEDPKDKDMEQDTGATVTVSGEIRQWTTDLSSLEKSKPKANEGSQKPVDPAIPMADEICGLLVVIINKAFTLPLDRKTACTYVKVTYNGKEYDSKTIYDYPGWDALNPIYDCGITIPITTTMPRDDAATVQLDLIQTANEKSTILGSTSVVFGDLKKLPKNTLTETHKMGDKGASLQYRLSLSGVEPPSRKTPSLRGVDDKSKSLDANEDSGSEGNFELTVVEARGLKVIQHLFKFDVPDAYCKIQVDGKLFETSVIRNNRNPKWNESHKWEVSDQEKIVSIELWDHNNSRPHELLGTAKVTVGNVLLAGGKVDVELKTKEGRPSGIHVAFSGAMV